MNIQRTIHTIILISLLFIFIIPTQAQVQILKSPKIVYPEFDPRVDPLYHSVPPLLYDNSMMTIVAFRSTHEALRALVPEPLEINSENLAWAYIFDHYLTDSFQYLEGGISIPVVFSDKKNQQEGIFVSYIYLQTPDVMTIPNGREIWGYPKKDALIAYNYPTSSNPNPIITSTITRNDIKIMDLSVDMTQMLDGPLYSLAADVYNLKYVPSIKKGAPPEVLQLTSSPVFNAPPFPLFKATLELSNSIEDHLADYLPIEEVIGGIFVEYPHMVLDYGDILFDYLTENIPKEGYRLGPDSWIYRSNK